MGGVARNQPVPNTLVSNVTLPHGRPPRCRDSGTRGKIQIQIHRQVYIEKSSFSHMILYNIIGIEFFFSDFFQFDNGYDDDDGKDAIRHMMIRQREMAYVIM